MSVKYAHTASIINMCLVGFQCLLNSLRLPNELKIPQKMLICNQTAASYGHHITVASIQ